MSQKSAETIPFMFLGLFAPFAACPAVHVHFVLFAPHWLPTRVFKARFLEPGFVQQITHLEGGFKGGFEDMGFKIIKKWSFLLKKMQNYALKSDFDAFFEENAQFFAYFKKKVEKTRPGVT